MDAEKLKEILDNHLRWMLDEKGGKVADLRGANLENANLCSAKLQGANLRCANLRGAFLRYANLRDASLRGANLRCANLRCANLRCANLRYADLRYANLQDADLQGADLQGADLRHADLQCADMRVANLEGTNLQDADLRDVKNLNPLIAARLSITPEGDLIGWKRCLHGVLVKLLIPTAAKRSNATGRKCRAEYATVLEVIGADVGLSIWTGTTKYRTGETVRCHEWCEDRWRECAGGIHFYLTREEAEAHT